MRLGLLWSFALLLASGGCLASAGCAGRAAKPDDSGSLPVTVRCANDAECRLVSDYCDGCACRALAHDEADPVCKGKLVQCFADPCQRKAPACQAGACVVAPAPS
jgi:hypothetical protein